MRIFVGYGYNDRDAWIESDVLPLLEALQMEVVHGKDMHGQVLQDGVRKRIDQSDALVAFFTLREGQEQADYNSHPWVRDELACAVGKDKPVLLVQEAGVKFPPAFIGNRQRINLNGDKLGCVRELIQALRGHWIRRLQLTPRDESLMDEIRTSMKNNDLKVVYRTRRGNVDSEYREASLERIKGGLYITATGVPDDALIEIEGKSGDKAVFFSDWESVDSIQVPVS